MREGIDSGMVHITGNTVVDALKAHVALSEERFGEEPVTGREYVLVTSHRQENVDNPLRLKAILSAMGHLSGEFGMDVVFPAHPRTVKMMAQFGYTPPEGVSVIDPVGYLRFLQMEAKASLIVTDSGGIQEEACILGVPCVTIRDNTERPETVDVGANVVAGTDEASIIAKAREMLAGKRGWANPYGDGASGKRIIDICLD
jgi:UDP-N-acetylglucosamine 2-epimerase (non-hydrolysing)